FADEPTGALDSRTSTEVLSELLNSTTGRGATLVLVTHDESVAARCSRVVRLADGAIIADSPRLLRIRRRRHRASGHTLIRSRRVPTIRHPPASQRGPSTCRWADPGRTSGDGHRPRPA